MPAELVATGPGEAPGEVFVEHLPAQAAAPADDLTADVPGAVAGAPAPELATFDATPGEPAQALPTEPVGVAGSPVPSAAPLSVEPERSFDRPLGEVERADDGVRASADPMGSALPDDFGRPERPSALQYTAPAFDAAPGVTGVTRSTGPGGTGVATGTPQNRNDECACGSGRKYKRCHGARQN